MSCEAIFLKQLRRRGYRLTPQREAVLLVLHLIGHPATAEEIFAQVSARTARVELSTVYRTLDLLHSMNLVAIIDGGDKQRLFELVGVSIPHLHLVCRVCGKITGVELDLLRPLLDHIQEDTHFTPDLGNLTLPGICEECARLEPHDPAASVEIRPALAGNSLHRH